MCDDFLKAEVDGNIIDVIVTFEAIEHIRDTQAVFNKFKIINPDTIILSTPHTSCPLGGNKFHHRHFGLDELVDRFNGIGYKVKRAELRYYNTSLDVFIVVEKR